MKNPLFKMETKLTLVEVLAKLSDFEVCALMDFDGDGISFEDWFSKTFKDVDWNVPVIISMEHTVNALICRIADYSVELQLVEPESYSETTYYTAAYMAKLFPELKTYYHHPDDNPINITMNAETTVDIADIVERFFECLRDHDSDIFFEEDSLMAVYETSNHHIVVATISQVVGGTSIGLSNLSNIIDFGNPEYPQPATIFIGELLENREDWLGDNWTLLASLSLNPIA